VTRRDVIKPAIIKTALVVLAIVVAVMVDVVVDYPVPGRMAVVALGSSFLLVLGAKWLAAAFLQRPVGTRVDELGNPADDISDDWIDVAPHAADRDPAHRTAEVDRA
jgi:hypothetical protein